jgi:hypothetical protein
MTLILPWLLFIVLDGVMEVPTTIRFESEDKCIEYGELLAMSMKVDLQLATHNIDPLCKLVPQEKP